MDESAPSSGTPNGTTATGTGRSAGEQLADIMGSTQAYTHLSENQKQVAERSANLTARENLASLSPRQWEKGDVYAPHDLSFAEALKWKKTKSVEKDRLDMLGLNPLDHYKVRCFSFSTGREGVFCWCGRALRSGRRGLSSGFFASWLIAIS